MRCHAVAGLFADDAHLVEATLNSAYAFYKLHGIVSKILKSVILFGDTASYSSETVFFTDKEGACITSGCSLYPVPLFATVITNLDNKYHNEYFSDNLIKALGFVTTASRIAGVNEGNRICNMLSELKSVFGLMYYCALIDSKGYEKIQAATHTDCDSLSHCKSNSCEGKCQ